MKSYLRYWPWLLLILIFLGGYGVAYFQQKPQLRDILQRVKYEVPDGCGFDKNSCNVDVNGSLFSITVRGNVTPLERFNIQLQGKAVQNVTVNMSMVDMDMGVNHFPFKEKTTGIFEVSVVLPVCTARRKDWLAEFYIDLISGEKINIVYPFNTR